MAADHGPITCDELIEVLMRWVGREVHILLGPAGPTAGRVYVRWHGPLTAMYRHPGVKRDDDVGEQPVALQIGDSAESFLAVHPAAVLHAEWVSRRFEFLWFGMPGVEVGIECEPEA